MKRFLLVALLCITGVAHAQTTPGREDLHVYLVTFGPGAQVWERFGHDALLVEDRATGYSIAWNWGMFDFNQPHFLQRFIKGHMLYWMAGGDGPATLAWFAKQNRSVWLQELNLTPDQRRELRDFAEWNSREENKFYRYDYYRDNCTTRIRDAIDLVTHGAVANALKPIKTNSTYRSHTQALTASDPALYTGLMLAMGPNIDQKLSAWDESFLPMELREWVRKVNVRAPDGSTQPLVLSERTYYQAPHEQIIETPPNRVIPFTIVGFLIGGLIVLLGRGARNQRALAVTLGVIVTLWCLVTGVLGTIIAYLWAFTDHIVTYRNENVLQANSISLILMVFAAASLMGRPWARRWAVWFGLMIAGFSVLGFIAQIFPGFDQNNGEIIGLFMPIHGAVAWVLWHRWRVRELAA